jgi:SAM-dependent methyltransferase
MADQRGGRDFDELYRDERSVDGLPALTPWDIGEAQPVVQQLAAYGGLRGEVLDPGTGPGHHAIHFASKGYATTGIDSSPAAIDRAKRNAQRAGAGVDFLVADATRLDGFENRFDTVVDSAFYHVFMNDEEMQRQYLQALHRPPSPGRGCSCSSSRGTTSTASISRACRLGTTTYQANLSSEALANMPRLGGRQDIADRLAPLHDQLRVIAPLLENHLIHMPFWAVAGTRLDEAA